MDLQPVDQWAHNYALWNLVVISPMRIVVGDPLQSVTVLKWNEAKKKLEVVGRDWTSLASMNVTADDEYVIQSDVSKYSGLRTCIDAKIRDPHPL